MLGARLTLPPGSAHKRRLRTDQLTSGRSSGVEHNLAKVGVEGSNPFARSSVFNQADSERPGLLGDRDQGSHYKRASVSVPGRVRVVPVVPVVPAVVVVR